WWVSRNGSRLPSQKWAFQKNGLPKKWVFQEKGSRWNLPESEPVKFIRMQMISSRQELSKPEFRAAIRIGTAARICYACA
ncbi:hypothetical protein, partial [Mesorhizobium sp.]|uniref:hypothetical protein n=1 Tax=Mesorhizobium sp. TaxID=1871066 RepID=UPI00257DB086